MHNKKDSVDVPRRIALNTKRVLNGLSQVLAKKYRATRESIFNLSVNSFYEYTMRNDYKAEPKVRTTYTPNSCSG